MWRLDIRLVVQINKFTRVSFKQVSKQFEEIANSKEICTRFIRADHANEIANVELLKRAVNLSTPRSEGLRQRTANTQHICEYIVSLHQWICTQHYTLQYIILHVYRCVLYHDMKAWSQVHFECWISICMHDIVMYVSNVEFVMESYMGLFVSCLVLGMLRK